MARLRGSWPWWRCSRRRRPSPRRSCRCPGPNARTPTPPSMSTAPHSTAPRRGGRRRAVPIDAALARQRGRGRWPRERSGRLRRIDRTLRRPPSGLRGRCRPGREVPTLGGAALPRLREPRRPRSPPRLPARRRPLRRVGRRTRGTAGRIAETGARRQRQPRLQRRRRRTRRAGDRQGDRCGLRRLPDREGGRRTLRRLGPARPHLRPDRRPLRPLRPRRRCGDARGEAPTTPTINIGARIGSSRSRHGTAR